MTPDEDNDLLCRQLLRIVSQIRTGAHVESSSVQVTRGGTLTIYGITVSLEPVEDIAIEDGSVVTVPKGVDVQYTDANRAQTMAEPFSPFNIERNPDDR